MQFREQIIYNGVSVGMYGEPLFYYLEQLPNPPEFSARSTACWRGYMGTWAIEDGRLFLINFSGSTYEKPVVDIQYLFRDRIRFLLNGIRAKSGYHWAKYLIILEWDMPLYTK